MQGRASKETTTKAERETEVEKKNAVVEVWENGATIVSVVCGVSRLIEIRYQPLRDLMRASVEICFNLFLDGLE